MREMNFEIEYSVNFFNYIVIEEMQFTFASWDSNFCSSIRSLNLVARNTRGTLTKISYERKAKRLRFLSFMKVNNKILMYFDVDYFLTSFTEFPQMQAELKDERAVFLPVSGGYCWTPEA